MKLLLVDDDEFLRDMYAIKFNENGCDVDVADGGVSTMSKLRKRQDFDVILLDMIMPGMSGVDLIKRIKKDFPDCEAKLIVLPNQGQTEDIKEATDAGAIGYIIKAESIPSEVVKKVESIIKK